MSNTALASLAGSTVELLVSCTELVNIDQFTKSDPMCVLFWKQFGQWKEYGRTEAIRVTFNPKFTTPFLLDFEPDQQQSLMFSVYDTDSRSTDLKHHDFVGSVELSLSSVLDPEKTITTTCKTLRVSGNPRARGLISVTAEILRKSRSKIYMHVGGHKIVKTGKIIAAKPDVYLEISRSIDNVSYHPVYRSETIHKTQNPRWRPCEMTLQRLCNGDWDRLVQFACWHHSGTGDYKLIGRKVTTVRELKLMKSDGHYRELSLLPKKEKNRKQSMKITTRGNLRIFQFRIDSHYSLSDFIRGGLQIHPIVGIDFTSSNGRLTDDLCYHSQSNANDNQYIDVMESLCGLISRYNKDERLAVFGFGAKLPRQDQTSHCFPLSLDWANTHVNGIKSAITTYKTAAESVKFSGPTRLKKVIALAESLAVREPTQDSQLYHVLIVITDGVINDFDDTIERLTSVSHLPLSVVFVGVGPADFSLMECFSAHNARPFTSTADGLPTSRHNTHFVPFRKDSASPAGNEAATRDVFAVLSSHILEYMRGKNITPNSRQVSLIDAASQSMVDVEVAAGETDNYRRASLVSTSSLADRAAKLTADNSGPTCPTCGQAVQPGTFLYSEMSSIT